MLALTPTDDPQHKLQTLCLGAHCDDIEIGCAGSLLELAQRYPTMTFRWLVFTSEAGRAGGVSACCSKSPLPQ